MVFDWNIPLVLGEIRKGSPYYVVECSIISITLTTSMKGEIYYTINIEPTKSLLGDSDDVYKDIIISKDLSDIYLFKDESTYKCAMQSNSLHLYNIRADIKFQQLSFNPLVGRCSDIFLDRGERLSIESVDITKSKLQNTTTFYGQEQKECVYDYMTVEDIRGRHIKFIDFVTIEVNTWGYSVQDLITKAIPKVGSSGFFMCDNEGSSAAIEGTLVGGEIFKDSAGKYRVNLHLLRYNEYKLRAPLDSFIFCRSYKTLATLRKATNTKTIKYLISKMLQNEKYKEVCNHLNNEEIELIKDAERISLLREHLVIETDSDKRIKINIKSPIIFNSSFRFIG